MTFLLTLLTFVLCCWALPYVIIIIAAAYLGICKIIQTIRTYLSSGPTNFPDSK